MEVFHDTATQWRNFKFRAPLQENHSGPLVPNNLQGGPKKVSQIIFAITLSTACQFP